jgi:hypothetical protein
MPMPSFVGSAMSAASQGATVQRCRICGNWEWVWPGDYPEGVAPVCGRRSCEEAAAKKTEVK